MADRSSGRARKKRLAHLAPSDWWACEISAGRVRSFPPPADSSPMIQCESDRPQCGGRFYPGYYIRRILDRVICEDCMNEALLADERRRRAEGLLAEPSEDAPFSRALDALRDVAGELAGSPLPSEDEEDLVREIARCRETGKIVVRYDDGSEVEIPDPPPGA